MSGAQRQTLLDFGVPADLERWMPVNDVVMGGVSSSRLDLAGSGIARFSGVVSLEHGGGFASVRTRPSTWPTDGAAAFVLRVRGDGHQYKFTLRTDAAFDGIQYQARFTPPPGTWTDVRLPVAEFVATYRGRALSGAPSLDPGAVRALGLMISDRQAGPFELLLQSIAVEVPGGRA